MDYVTLAFEMIALFLLVSISDTLKGWKSDWEDFYQNRDSTEVY